MLLWPRWLVVESGVGWGSKWLAREGAPSADRNCVWSKNPTKALGLSNGKNSGLSEMSREGNEVRCITGAKRP